MKQSNFNARVAAMVADQLGLPQLKHPSFSNRDIEFNTVSLVATLNVAEEISTTPNPYGENLDESHLWVLTSTGWQELFSPPLDSIVCGNTYPKIIEGKIIIAFLGCERLGGNDWDWFSELVVLPARVVYSLVAGTRKATQRAADRIAQPIKLSDEGELESLTPSEAAQGTRKRQRREHPDAKDRW